MKTPSHDQPRPSQSTSCDPPTSDACPRSGCAPANCAPGSPPWASPSAWPPSSPSSGLSSSASAGLLNEISALGTNLLVVQNGQTLSGGTAELPKAAPAMIARITAVTHVEETGSVSGDVYRSPLIPAIDTNALSIDAASLGLLHTVGTTIAQGSYLNAATANEPVAVLGAAAAQRLGIDRVFSGERIWARQPVVLRRRHLATRRPRPRHRLLGAGRLPRRREATSASTDTPPPSTSEPRTATSTQVDNLLAATANPENPSEVDVSQPSAALVAQADAQGAFDDLFLGLGAVALLVGAVGVANIMIISVLERRSEIGLRRALGATRGHIRVQFLAEAVLLALIGGAVGVGAGALSTAVYANAKHELVVIPALAWGGGIGAAILIGAVAGLLARPARRTHVTHPSPVEHVSPWPTDGSCHSSSLGSSTADGPSPCSPSYRTAVAATKNSMTPSTASRTRCSPTPSDEPNATAWSYATSIPAGSTPPPSTS